MTDQSATKGKTGSSGSKKSKDFKNLTGRQKAAIFLVSLGSEVSSVVFKHLREDEIETLTFEIARIDNIDAEVKDAVLEEFQELMSVSITGNLEHTC